MLNIIKLAVGIEDVDHLSAIQQGRLADEKARRGKDARLFHRTRNAPRQSEELLKGEFKGKNKILVDAKWDSDHERIERLDFKGEFCKKTAKAQEETMATAAVGSADDTSDVEPDEE